MSTYYFIMSKLDGNVIDIVGASTSAGAGLDAYPQKATGTNNQLWEFVLDPAGSGYYFIKSMLNGNVIDIEGASTAAGALLDAYPQKATGTNNQLWEFVPDPAGSGYCFIKSKLNGNVIDIQRASTTAGALLDADNQLWTVIGGTFPSVVPTGPYFIKSKLDGNVIDIVGASTSAGAGLDAYPQKATGTNNQLWEFVPDPAGSGYYFIKSKLDGNVIDIQGASTTAGALLDAYPQKATGTNNQLWEFVPDPAGSGYCFIVSKLNGNVIDIQGASTTAGALLDAYPLKVSGTDNQLWTVIGGVFPSAVPAVPAPSGGLGSNYNYLLNSACNSLTGLSATINVFANIVGSDGFGFQVNAYSAKSDYDAAQQYLIFLDPHSNPATLYCMVDNWTVQGGQSQIINHIVQLATLPSQMLPAGYQLKISLENDSSGNITGATYVVIDNTGKTIGNQTITLLSLSGVTSKDLAPIVAFQLDFVDYLNGGSTTLSSGAGAISYSASNQMTALSSAPACVDWNYITLETANSSYGVLPSNSNQIFTQFFQASAAAVEAVTPKPGTVLHTTSRRSR